MSAQTAPLLFRSTISRGANTSTWKLTTTQQTVVGGIQYGEYRFTTRGEAFQEAIKQAFDHKKAVAEWESTKRHEAMRENLESIYARQKEARDREIYWTAPGLTPEAEARANAYLADNPLMYQELRSLFGNWQNSI